MARVSPVNSDSENVDQQPTSPKENLKKDDDEKMDVEGGEDSKGDEEESEYEIEAILDAKRGSFPNGRMGYYVKWKGYGDDENSWVDELDAGNAESLIAEFWKQNKKKAPRKSTEAKTPKRVRVSSAAEDNSDLGSASAAKKRGRKSKADSDLENGRDEGENDGSRTRKKPRRSAAAKAQKAVAQEEGEVEIGDMSNHMLVPDWERLIKSVDTVERDDEGMLWVYFTLHNGEHVKEKSILCAERFPQKLIQFYEKNLRWRSSEEI